MRVGRGVAAATMVESFTTTTVITRCGGGDDSCNGCGAGPAVSVRRFNLLRLVLFLVASTLVGIVLRSVSNAVIGGVEDEWRFQPEVLLGYHFFDTRQIGLSVLAAFAQARLTLPPSVKQ